MSFVFVLTFKTVAFGKLTVMGLLFIVVFDLVRFDNVSIYILNYVNEMIYYIVKTQYIKTNIPSCLKAFSEKKFKGTCLKIKKMNLEVNDLN